MPCRCAEFLEPIHTYAQLRARCEALPKDFDRGLETLLHLPDQWAYLERCGACGTLWCLECPFSELQGGGPRCYYAVPEISPDEWKRSYRPLTDAIVASEREARLMAALGDEVGPERCRIPGCGRLRIALSTACRQHHRESMFGKLQRPNTTRS